MLGRRDGQCPKIRQFDAILAEMLKFYVCKRVSSGAKAPYSLWPACMGTGRANLKLEEKADSSLRSE
jgi:hypothetical protein